MSALPPECQQLLVSGYILGNLSPGEAALFAEMLAENPDLIDQVRQMQQALDLAYNPVEVTPPTSLRDRLLSAANAQPGETIAVANTPPPAKATKTQSKLPLIIGAAALFLATLFGINSYRRFATLPDTVQTSTKTYLLEGKNIADAVVKLIANDQQLNGQLRVSSLPPLPPEKAYALWTVVGKDVPYTTDDKGAILTAVFQVDAMGNFNSEIALPQPHLEPKTIQKMAITVEDVTAPQAHTGSIVVSTK